MEQTHYLLHQNRFYLGNGEAITFESSSSTLDAFKRGGIENVTLCVLCVGMGEE